MPALGLEVWWDEPHYRECLTPNLRGEFIRSKLLQRDPPKLCAVVAMVAREQGIDVNTRAKLLNHSDIRTLQQYDYVFPEETAGARERVREALKTGVSGFSHSTETPPSEQKPLLDLLKDGRDLPE